MPTAQEIYKSSIRDLPPAERLRLAALILDELTQSDTLPSDVSGTWSEEDEHDLAAFSLQHAETLYPEEDGRT
jgi:hypothetical protein